MRLLFISAPRFPLTRCHPRFKPCAFQLSLRKERSVGEPLSLGKPANQSGGSRNGASWMGFLGEGGFRGGGLASAP